MSSRLSAPATLTIEDIVSRTPDLPTLPAATLAVMRETSSPTGSASTVGKYLSQDPSLAVRVLRLANSAYFGFSRQIIDVSEAVVVLGMRSVHNLALIASTYPWLTRPLSGYALGPNDLWAHSFGVAIGSQLVAKKCGKISHHEAFTAGLLHDVGKVALSVWLENKMPALCYIAEVEHRTFNEVERRVLGYDHQDVGGHMGRAWNLPEPLVQCMEFHHRPEECEPRNLLVDCVHIGDLVAMSIGLGLGGDGMNYDASALAAERLGLSLEDVEYLADDLSVEYAKQEKLFEVLKP